MKTLFASLILCAGIAAAQTTVSVSITLDDNTQKIVNSWRKAQCATVDEKGACIALRYETLKSLISAIVADAVNARIATAGQWAVETKDSSLPAAVTKAIDSVTTATATITATKQAKAIVQ